MCFELKFDTLLQCKCPPTTCVTYPKVHIYDQITRYYMHIKLHFRIFFQIVIPPKFIMPQQEHFYHIFGPITAEEIKRNKEKADHK